jgi:hypothetical protein
MLPFSRGGALLTKIVAVLPLSAGEPLVSLPHQIQDVVRRELLSLLRSERIGQGSSGHEERGDHRGRGESQHLATSECGAAARLRRRATAVHEVLLREEVVQREPVNFGRHATKVKPAGPERHPE